MHHDDDLGGQAASVRSLDCKLPDCLWGHVALQEISEVLCNVTSPWAGGLTEPRAYTSQSLLLLHANDKTSSFQGASPGENTSTAMNAVDANHTICGRACQLIPGAQHGSRHAGKQRDDRNDEQLFLQPRQVQLIGVVALVRG